MPLSRFIAKTKRLQKNINKLMLILRNCPPSKVSPVPSKEELETNVCDTFTWRLGKILKQFKSEFKYFQIFYSLKILQGRNM